MSKAFDYLIIIVITLGIGILVGCMFLRKTNISTTEYNEIQHAIYMQNKHMPISLGCFGEIEEIKLIDDTIVWNVQTYGGEESISLNQENPCRLDYIQFAVKAMCNNPAFSNFLDYDLHFKCVTYSRFSDKIDEFIISHEDIKYYKEHTYLTSLESLCEAINRNLNSTGLTPIGMALENLFSDSRPNAIVAEGRLVIVYHFSGNFICNQEQLVSEQWVAQKMEDINYRYFNDFLKACNITTYIIRLDSKNNFNHRDLIIPII